MNDKIKWILKRNTSKHRPQNAQTEHAWVETLGRNFRLIIGFCYYTDLNNLLNEDQSLKCFFFQHDNIVIIITFDIDNIKKKLLDVTFLENPKKKITTYEQTLEFYIIYSHDNAILL